MTRDELLEKVAQAMASCHGYKPDNLTYREARVAISMVLEETALMVEAMPRTYDKVKEDHDILGLGRGTWTFTLNNGPKECAAAIRSLIPQESST